jgi:hypothetical protein
MSVCISLFHVSFASRKISLFLKKIKIEILGCFLPVLKKDFQLYYSIARLMFQVIAVNKQFPGPIMNVTTNYNVVVNVLNSLDEPLLITW